ncbi:multidrug resistance efflux transporter family protein [Bacillus sp. AGMB 02131]|uniref:Multidrug resistance efflux transporter family protein n=1 Tax=Peribacillus faecalis TaxID=2772559 RepID=A0A927CV88_9BACI|nr:multidrug resistance efflux transporter family protein [Peribacillus faecalis]MBD3108437.1 multidrug resistance efflux transporter family protein [Peribacillus faecalis]
MKPIILGICSAFFFAFTFVLNSAMELSGGSWIWSASLRYIFMVPFLLMIVLLRSNLRQLLQEMKSNPLSWIGWSFVGFGLFYAPLCYATVYSPGWLIAGTWQITIISGTLLAPLFYETIRTHKGPVTVRGTIPIKGLLMSSIILLGILLMQVEHTKSIAFSNVLLGVVPVIVASFAYPLGNRKMMQLTQGRLDAFQRVLGMTLASLPFWFLLSGYGYFTVGLPTVEQSFQAFLVAISSGVIATVLFFKATDLVSGDMQKLASVEATQSIEVLFALLGEMIFLSIAVPSALSWLGIVVVIAGMTLHSFASYKTTELIADKKKIAAK